MMSQSTFEQRIDGVSFRLARSPSNVILVLIMILFAGTALHFLEVDPDLFARAAAGKLILQSGIPLQDPFAFTKTKEIWHDHEWLLSPLFYLTAHHGGDLGLFLLKLLASAGFFFILITALRNTAPQYPPVLSLSWFLILLPDLFNPWLPTIRCQALTYLLYAGLLYILILYRQGQRRWVWLLPGLFAVWVNGHGGVLAGLGTLFLFVLTNFSREKVLPCVAVLCACALFLNPYGTEYVRFLFEAGLKKRELVPEWDTLSLFSATGVYFFFIAAIFFIGSLTAPAHHRKECFIIGLPIAAASFLNQRLTPLFGIFVLLWGIPAWTAAVGELKKHLPRLFFPLSRSLCIAAGALLLYATAVCIHQISKLSSFTLDYSRYPVEELEWLRSHRSGGDVLVHFNEGSFALWRLAPHFKISLDGRYEEVYPDETVGLVLAALSSLSPHHLSALEAVNPDFVVIERSSLERSDYETYFPGFIPAFDGSNFSILEREAARELEMVEKRIPLPMWSAEF